MIQIRKTLIDQVYCLLWKHPVGGTVLLTVGLFALMVAIIGIPLLIAHWTGSFGLGFFLGSVGVVWLMVYSYWRLVR